MNRTDTLKELDSAIVHLGRVLENLNQMGATYSMCLRVESKINRLCDLRVDIMQADLILKDGE